MMITTAITLIYAAKIQLFTDTHAYLINYSSESDDFMPFIRKRITGTGDSYESESVPVIEVIWSLRLSYQHFPDFTVRLADDVQAALEL